MFPVALAVLLFAIVSKTQANDPATLAASIKSAKNYSLLPACVQQCVWDISDDDTGDIGGDVAIHLSCSSPWINGCYCRPSSATVAHSFISSCATYLCSTPQPTDIAAGTSVYASYCSQALGAAYTPEGVDQTAPEPTAATDVVITSATPAPSRPTASLAQQTSSASESSPSSSDAASLQEDKPDEKIAGLSKGAFIGVVVSASCSVLGLLFGVWFKVHKYRQQMKLAQQNPHMAYPLK
ncbi:hypothetical protein BU23DRAFT_313521 [Bimuria novae-zelandiae CBS 107.79]|uniref:Extracellular membrane protein CFEM domain-containing protein n=1 Tax=Bimuria novae-zelandiae CBS 107.79 TaxID=1447943 RepID=A0A6A5UQN3_9PLEO|nr:hypothetical protein BU23DRAFT_313521 [Bimuria novae-zelandiae CBS 107.79]